MENTIYLSSAYLAPVEYYTKLFACEKAYVEQYDNYVKQTYRNRCVIAAADGPLALTIPTEKSGTPKCLMKDVRISDHGNWRHIHWNALVAAYRNSPFFEYYADDFHVFYSETEVGPVTQKLYDELTGIQFGDIQAPEGWIVPVD